MLVRDWEKILAVVEKEKYTNQTYMVNMGVPKNIKSAYSVPRPFKIGIHGNNNIKIASKRLRTFFP